MIDLATIATGSRIYVDSNIFIYFLETDGDLHRMVRAISESVEAVGARLVTSDITLAECHFRPARENNATLVRQYETLLEDTDIVELVPLSGGLVKLAAMQGRHVWPETD